jgi:hypothetical protein
VVEGDGEAVVAEAEVRHRVPRPGLVRRGGEGGRRGRHAPLRRDPAAREAEADGEEGRLVVVAECERGGGRATEARCDGGGHAAAVESLFDGGDLFFFFFVDNELLIRNVVGFKWQARVTLATFLSKLGQHY